MRTRRAKAPKLTEAERLRQHNEEMKRALADNITVLEARKRLAWDRFQIRNRCGTSAEPERQPATPPTPAPAQPTFWWKDDRL